MAGKRPKFWDNEAGRDRIGAVIRKFASNGCVEQRSVNATDRERYEPTETPGRLPDRERNIAKSLITP